VEDGRIVEAFRDDGRLAGTEAPEPRAAPSPGSVDAFVDRWRRGRKTVAHAVASACPLFDRTLGTETAARAGIDPDVDPDVDDAVLEALFEAAVGVRQELIDPSPRIYWDGEEPAIFSLIGLRHVVDHHVRDDRHYTEERFDTVDAAARIFVRRSLARRRFHELYDPVVKALVEAVDHYRTSLERMLDELSKESRADRYERWGHLLMAGSNDVPHGADEVELEDLFADGEPVTVPLDPALSAVENAEKYYDRARRTRRSREEAEKRLVDTERQADEAAQLLAALHDVDGLTEIRTFRKERAAELSRYMPDEESPEDRIPFRRFKLEGDYQVWVGRNARQNDDLTFHHAQKYDLWMHARGMPGSHTVLRLPNRDAQPDRRIVSQAASIAAYFSKARGSGLVPVMIAERKHVRKPSGAGPGAVAVEHEEVVIVEPRLPE
ncbi:MAG: NFACT RNA binding domain-containing protein, partial [Rhodothermales bacterium]